MKEEFVTKGIAKKLKEKGFKEECLLLDSKHYETCGITYHLDAYNAYDDKGNKIEGEYITLTKKEYDSTR